MVVHAPIAELPQIIDPLLDYLAQVLPSPLYRTLVVVLSQAFSLISSGFSLLASLRSWKPWEWDAQTILPPLITVLLAYYTLLSMYRTTTWAVRMGFWMMKWSIFIGLFGSVLGWVMGQDNGGGILATLLGALQGQQGHPSASRRRSGQRAYGVGARSRTKPRPKPWESFDSHRDWQYNEDAARAQDGGAANLAQQVMGQIASLAGRAVGVENLDIIGAARKGLDYLADITSEDAAEGVTAGKTNRKNRPKAGSST